MTGVPCKSGQTRLSRGKQRPVWHQNRAEVEACPFCKSTPATDPTPPKLAWDAPGASLAPPSPPATPGMAPASLTTAGPQKIAWGATAPAEVLSTPKAKGKGVPTPVWDGYLDWPHVETLWDQVLFFWLRNGQLALDRFVFKVEFHIPDSQFRISEFARNQAAKGDVRNLYTVWGSNLVRIARPPDLQSAQVIVEDLAMLSSFAGLGGAFLMHYRRILKEAPGLDKWRAARAERKAKLEAMRLERERKTAAIEAEARVVSEGATA
ncbi:MAG: hypothetical protein ACLP74_01500 [Thermoplasmata archaeon]